MIVQNSMQLRRQQIGCLENEFLILIPYWKTVYKNPVQNSFKIILQAARWIKKLIFFSRGISRRIIVLAQPHVFN